MKTLLKKNKNSEIDFLLLGSLYESLYAKVEEVLSSEEAATFCNIERKKNECVWYGVSQAVYRPLPTLSDEEKFKLSDILAATKANILPKLKADQILAPHAEILFKVPAEDDIYQVKKADGSIGVALSRWGTKLSMTVAEADPIVKLINIPKPDHSQVIIVIKYSDGSLFAKTLFHFSYQDNTKKQFRTNNEGQFNLGRLKNGRSFTISQFANQDGTTFTVDESRSIYELIFPIYVDFEVLAINQEDTPVAQQNLILTHGEHEQLLQTNENGLININAFLLQEDKLKIQTENGEYAQEYSLSKDTGRLVFRLMEKFHGEVSILVQNEAGQVLNDYPISVLQNDQETIDNTNYEGRVELDNIEIGQSLLIIDGNDKYNKINHVVTKGSQEILLEVNRPLTPPVKVKLLDHKKRPIPSIPMDFNIGGNVSHEKTNEEGSIFLTQDLFTHNEKVKIDLHITNKKGKKKLVKKSFKYEDHLNEYTLRLKKIRWWWLLLLLPFLLLVRCEKEVYVKVLEEQSNQPLSDVAVHFGHNKAYLFDQGRFFTNDPIHLSDTSNSKGFTEFTNLKYSIYSWVFKFRSPAIIYANDACVISDTIHPWFHFIYNKDTIDLRVKPKMTLLDFKVVDAEDNEPIPDALVIIESKFWGKIVVDSAKTDPNGRVVFDQVPKCGKINIVKGTAEGYYPDEIKGKSPAELSGPIENKRKLELDPIKEKLIFFVKDCKTGKPIPGAKVTIEIDYNGKNESQKKRTNVNGVGKGEYSDAHIIADVALIGEAPPYYESGKLPTYKVGDFIRLPDSLRTICLEPKPNTIEFRNVDSLTNQPLPGVENHIVIENGDDKRENVAISNKNGEFIIELYPGDKVTIISKHPPYYEDNTTKIRDSDAINLIEGPSSGRTIPLSPKMIELLFRTVDFDDPSVIISDANISTMLAINGHPIYIPTPVRSNSRGEFTIKAPIISTISIDAFKIGYGNNNTKINNVSFEALAQAPQADRDIPLKKEPPPCNTQESTGGDGITMKEYDMVNPGMQFFIPYNMKSIPDELIVYCGRKNNPQQILASTSGAVSGSGTLQIDLRQCSSTWITIKVIGGTDTDWSYKIRCE